MVVIVHQWGGVAVWSWAPSMTTEGCRGVRSWAVQVVCGFVSGGWSFVVEGLLAVCSCRRSCVGGGCHSSWAPFVVSGTADGRRRHGWRMVVVDGLLVGVSSMVVGLLFGHHRHCHCRYHY